MPSVATQPARQLGRSGIHVRPWAFGGNVFGWTADERASHNLLDAFVDAGFSLIDTADVYSRWAPGNKGGESETIIGKWLRKAGNRQKVVIATKVGMETGLGERGLSREYILRAADRSLRRLQTDHVDLYQSHVDDESTPQEQTLEAYAKLVEQGKVRFVGASNFTAARLASALHLARQGYPRYETLQPLYNLHDRADFEDDLQPLCVEHDIGVIPYFSLASGFLTGKYRSEKDLQGRTRGDRVKKYMTPRGQRILAALDAVARRRGAAPACVALAWLMTRPSIAAPIASATSMEQFRDLVVAADLQLQPEDVSELSAASAA